MEAFGLDPAIGILHEVDGSRPSLALDLVQPFRRAVADRFVLTHVNRAVLQKGDFELGDMTSRPRYVSVLLEQLT